MAQITFSVSNNSDQYNNVINKTSLKVVSVVKDFGILLDSNVTFPQHIDHAL